MNSRKRPAQPVAFPLTVYYDASCPLCRQEMHTLKRYHACDELQLVDCSIPGFNDPFVANAGLSQAMLMKTLHARDANGQWLRGVEVFEQVYRRVGLTRVARTLAHPRWRRLWDVLYPWVAKHRMGLSRLGITGAFGWMIQHAARRAQLKTQACQNQNSTC